MIAPAIKLRKARPPMTPPTIAPTGGELAWWSDEFGLADDPELVPGAELEFVLVLELELELELVVEDGVGYPAGYCVPVETPFDPV